VVAFDRDKRMIASFDVGLPPASDPCDPLGRTYAVLEFLGADEGPARGPLALTVRDEGVLLCTAIGVVRRSRDCLRPPLTAYDSHVLSRRAERRTVFAGVFPPEVASVELRLVGGGSRRVPTDNGGSYGGRYRGLVRFMSVALDGSREAYETLMLDRGGRVIARRPGPDFEPLERAPIAVARARGIRLGAAASLGGGKRSLCLVIARGRLPRDRCISPEIGSLFVRSFCGPPAVVLTGFLRARRASVTVTTDHGRIRSRGVRLPRRLAFTGRAFLIVVPPGRAIRTVVVRDRRAHKLRLRLPPARRECGYHDFV
jgi:hypothetical protein